MHIVPKSHHYAYSTEQNLKCFRNLSEFASEFLWNRVYVALVKGEYMIVMFLLFLQNSLQNFYEIVEKCVLGTGKGFHTHLTVWTLSQEPAACEKLTL